MKKLLWLRIRCLLRYGWCGIVGHNGTVKCSRCGAHCDGLTINRWYVDGR